MKYFGKIAAAALAVSLCFSLTACRRGGEDADTKGNDTSPTETVTESYTDRYDWSVLNTASNGSGEKRRGGVPYSYLVPEEYYVTSESDRVREGVRRISYGIKLTGLKDSELMANINSAVSEAQTAILADQTWIDEGEENALKKNYPDDYGIVPVNYAASDVTVMGNVLSVSILFIHSYNVKDEAGNVVDDVTEREGRYLYNFDLATGRVVKLPELFDSDVNYVALLTRLMNSVGEEVGYEFRQRISGLPDGFDIYCFSESGLVIGLPDGNPFVEGEKWFSIPVSELIGSMSLDPEETAVYFKEDVVLKRIAFRVPNLIVREESFEEPFGGEKISLPTVSGITSADRINNDLRSWYRDITARTYFTEEELAGGGTYSAQVEAPARVICVTVFVYCASSGEYRTLSHVYDVRTGNRLTVGDLLTDEAKTHYPKAVLSTVNFRISSEFLIGVPEQTGIEEYTLTEAGDVNLSYFEG
ncbi:MAG: hypothetical protein IJM21_01140 [Clostridia bacterium]|nr:hypothetical protein [Clostridia bacterium]